MLKDSIIEDDVEIEDLISKFENITVSFYQKNILYYITGNIIQKFLQKCTCLHCHDIVLMPHSNTVMHSITIFILALLHLLTEKSCAFHRSVAMIL